MCGISGFVDFNKQTTEQQLHKMNRTLAHRGPDGEGYAMYHTNEASIGFGHRRLSIIDLTETGSQPQQYLQYHITYNGEVYNHAEIKKELELLGHQFTSHSDTEVIIHAFAEWGQTCLHKFIGMFAFTIYDDKAQKIFACRDRAGVKPYNYYWHNNLFLFASEFKAIAAHPQFNKQINTDALGIYMQYGYIPAPHSIYQHTYKLKPGHFLEIDIASKKLTTTQYWNVYDAYNKPVINISLEDAVDETEKLLLNAFQYRMVSDVPVGVFLSGGYDSALVTTLLQKTNTEKIKTFTIGMPDAGLNEAPAAKAIANYLGTDHTEHYCTANEALAIVPTLPFFYDEPFADSSAIPTMLVSKVAKQQVTVALSADAGDEVFAGYNRYDYVVKYGPTLKAIPGFLRHTMAAALGVLPNINGKKNKFAKVQHLLKGNSDSHIVTSLSKHFTDKQIGNLCKANIKQLHTAFDSTELVKPYASTLEHIMAVDYQTYLPDDILQKVDRAGMAFSLEGREPFLDHRIVEWAAQLPMNYKYKNGSKKFILKEILHKHIPKVMMDRPKTGFGIPIAAWLSNELKHYIDEYLNDDFLHKQNLFNLAPVQHLKKQFFAGQHDLAEKLWFLLMFQMWYKQWM